MTTFRLVLLLVGVMALWYLLILTVRPVHGEEPVADIMEIETARDYGWYVGHVECLVSPAIERPAVGYYTDGMTEQEKADFADGRAKGCQAAIDEVRQVMKLCRQPVNAENPNCYLEPRQTE